MAMALKLHGDSTLPLSIMSGLNANPGEPRQAAKADRKKQAQQNDL
jgi:hypothetical protein